MNFPESHEIEENQRDLGKVRHTDPPSVKGEADSSNKFKRRE